MTACKANLLLVDDDASIRKLLSVILTQSGYSVRLAEDGFSALAKIREECPDVILSDLNMPGMSGFEFLSVVRRRCPDIYVIAMSSMFPGDGVPVGVAADRFYEKGTNINALLKMLGAATQEKQLFLSPERSSGPAPIWVPTNGHDRSGIPYVMIPCPECHRIFKQILEETCPLIQQVDCVHCESPIFYAIVPPVISAGMNLSSARG